MSVALAPRLTPPLLCASPLSASASAAFPEGSCRHPPAFPLKPRLKKCKTAVLTSFLPAPALIALLVQCKALSAPASTSGLSAVLRGTGVSGTVAGTLCGRSCGCWADWRTLLFKLLAGAYSMNARCTCGRVWQMRRRVFIGGLWLSVWCWLPSPAVCCVCPGRYRYR